MRLPVDRWVKKGLFRLYAPLGWARRPNSVTLDVTRRCNLRCAMCFYYGDESRHLPEVAELSAAEIISRVVDRVGRVDYNLSGGEPFVRSDLPEILTAIRRRKCGVAVATNGTLLNQALIERIVGENLLTGISFSIQGGEATHDQVTRVPGSFQRATGNLAKLVAERERQGAREPRVNISCTVGHGNFGVVRELAGLKDSLGADTVNFSHCSFVTPNVAARHQAALERLELACHPDYDELITGPPLVSAPPEDVEEFLADIRALRAAGADFQTWPSGYTEDDVRRHYLDEDWVYRPYCNYPFRSLRVGPDGTITPCLGHVVGNLRETDVRAIWNNRAFRRFRAILYRERLFPGCFRCCKLK
ncbi:MAG: radical SAM protein [Deltaproteobacteria bacterium]|nr:radical SAM protein [Deltaproteobacteria bacterium]